MVKESRQIPEANDQAEKPSRLEQLKRQYKAVYELRVPADDEGREIAVGYLKKPNLDTLAASASIAQSNPIKAAEVVLRNCWIEGDERILNEEEFLISALTALESLIQVRKATLVKH